MQQNNEENVKLVKNKPGSITLNRPLNKVIPKFALKVIDNDSLENHP
jgi:hypothetical protein